VRPKHGQESEKQGEPCPKQQCIQPPTYESKRLSLKEFSSWNQKPQLLSQFYGQFSHKNVKFWLAIYITKRLFPNIQARGLGLQFKYRDFFAGKISERSKVNGQKLEWSTVKLPKRAGQSFDPRSQL